MPLKIYLSPSNQPANKYAVGNTNEKLQMEAVAAKVHELLGAYDCEVVMATLSLSIAKSERPTEAKNKGCQYYVAIHSNAVSSGPATATGAVAFYHPNGAKSRELAAQMVEQLDVACPIQSNRSAQIINGMTALSGGSLGEIRSPMELGISPVLVEVNFHDNPKTAQWIIENHTPIARAIASSIVTVLGIPKVFDNTPDPYAKSHVDWAVSNKILVGDEKGDLKLHSPITRQDSVVLLKKVYDFINKK